ncbi:MAG: hypothetical protein Q4B26_05845 [Eubacteriales bacterium]|nr:hypothetical protein [Eubacteriales bacterium]
MLLLLFVILMLGVFGKLLVFAIKLSWQISKIIITLVVVPCILTVLALCGYMNYLIPILLIVGVFALLKKA